MNDVPQNGEPLERDRVYSPVEFVALTRLRRKDGHLRFSRGVLTRMLFGWTRAVRRKALDDAIACVTNTDAPHDGIVYREAVIDRLNDLRGYV